jgi:hypothetical protein
MRKPDINSRTIVRPLGGLTEDVIWVRAKYPQVLKKLAKRLYFAEHGKDATLLAGAYICGFVKAVQLQFVDEETPNFLAVNRNRRKRHIPAER